MFSVVIPAYNCELTIRSTLISVLSQLCSNDEVIVVNDGSTDKTLEVVNGFLSETYNLKVYSKDNEGKASIARNFGIERASKDVILFLDADDQFLPGKLDALRNIFLVYPDTKFLFHDFKVSNAETIKIESKFEQIGQITRLQDSLVALEDNLYQGKVGLYNLLSVQELPAIHTITVAVKKEALLELDGMFDENMRLGEDVDLWFRLLKNNQVATCVLNAVLSNYVRREGSLTDCSESEMLSSIIEIKRKNFARGLSCFSKREKKIIASQISSYCMRKSTVEKKLSISWFASIFMALHFKLLY